MKHKLFIGIPLPDFIKNHLIVLQQNIKKGEPLVHVIPENNLHITLKFIGLVEEKVIQEILLVLNQINMPQFHIFLGHLELVTKKDHQLIWCTVKGKTLADAVQNIEDIVRPWVAPEGRSFQGHITLVRARDALLHHAGLIQFIEQTTFNDLYFTAEYFQLMVSQSTPEGVQYTVLGQFPLL